MLSRSLRRLLPRSTVSDNLMSRVLKFRFSAFELVDVVTVQRLIRQAANKNCELDPVLTWLVKQFAVELSPFIAVLFSASFRDGFFRRRRNALSSRLH